MGIKGLTQLLKKFAPDSYNHCKLFHLSGKKVAIDASLFIYQSLIVYRRNGDYIRNDKGENISHIIGILNKTVTYLSYNITPIFIFDGAPPDEKKDVIKERKERATNATEKLDSRNIDPELAEKYNKLSIRLTKEIIDDIKELLNKLGVSYIVSDGEAEGLASELCRKKYVDYVISEDMDCLPFGAGNLVRNCIDKKAKMKDSITIFNLEKILKSLEITHEQFIELCILCGCDYCKNIPRIGSVSAYKIIKNHGSIENYLNNTKVKNLPENYVEKYKKSIELFNIYNQKIDIDQINIHESHIDVSKVISYLTDKCNYNLPKINNVIYKIQNKY